MKEISMRSWRQHYSTFAHALSTTLGCMALLSLTHCEAELADTEVGAVGQAVKNGQNNDEPTCAAGDGCKQGCTPLPDFDCPEDTGGSASWRLSGSYDTALSGYPGTSIPLGNAQSSSRGVYAILSNERSDEPCYVSVATEDVNNATLDTVYESDLCGPQSYNEMGKTLHADFLDEDAGGIDDHVFVNGVQVCMNAGYDKVKGIAVSGVKLQGNGKLVAVASVSDKRAHCDDDRWMSWENCLDGQIATEVELQYSAGLPPNDLTGISLHCRDVVQK